MNARDLGLAHSILRVTLGINIALHGIQRFPHYASFVNGVVHQFGGVLPEVLVRPYAAAIPAAEALIGVLLIAGLASRVALVAGAVLMASLTFGTALRGEHEVLAEQLGYELTYFALNATVAWNRFSLDALVARTRTRHVG